MDAPTPEPAEGPLNNSIAILVAVVATIMALANIKGGNVVQAMASAKTREVDSWSYYQAKSTKQSIAEGVVDQLLLMRDSNPQLPETLRAAMEAKIKAYQEKVARYDKEKAEIKAGAEAAQKEYEGLNVHDDQLDLAEAAMSLSIALFGITALTQRRWLLALSTLVALFGAYCATAAFMGWDFRLSALSALLG